MIVEEAKVPMDTSIPLSSSESFAVGNETMKQEKIGRISTQYILYDQTLFQLQHKY